MTQRAEIGEVVETGAEEAGVDGAGDGRAGGDGGDDRDAEHVGDVVGTEGATRLGHQDHTVAGHAHGERRGEGDVARASQHQVPLAIPAGRLDARRCSARVDDHDTGDRDLSAVVGGEEQRRGDLDRCRAVRGGDTEDRRCRNRLRRHQDRVLLNGGEEGDGSSHRRSPLSSPGADQGDRSGHRLHPHAAVDAGMERPRYRDGEISLRPVTPSAGWRGSGGRRSGLPDPTVAPPAGTGTGRARYSNWPVTTLPPEPVPPGKCGARV